DAFGSVAVSGNFAGTIDVGGGVFTSAGSTDLYVAKYDPSGAYLWSKHFGDPANQTVRNMSIDTSGNLLLTGLTQGPVDFGGGPGGSGGAPGPGDAVCAGAKPLPATDGTPSGFAQCPDGTIHRNQAVACDPVIVAPACTGTEKTITCQSDADCTAGLHGKCVS